MKYGWGEGRGEWIEDGWVKKGRKVGGGIE
jgi:hypothetical protein